MKARQTRGSHESCIIQWIGWKSGRNKSGRNSCRGCSWVYCAPPWRTRRAHARWAEKCRLGDIDRAGSLRLSRPDVLVIVAYFHLSSRATAAERRSCRWCPRWPPRKSHVFSKDSPVPFDFSFRRLFPTPARKFSGTDLRATSESAGSDCARQMSLFAYSGFKKLEIFCSRWNAYCFVWINLRDLEIMKITSKK